MADTPATNDTGETATQGTVSNDVSQASAPATDNTSSADAEQLAQLKKQLDQEKMRNNQLANQLTEKQKAEQEAKQKQLEEKEEFKTLYEQTQSKLSELEQAQQESERQKALSTATEGIFKDYSPEVVDLAKTAGLTLSEDTDEARSALKEKLDTFKSKVPSASVSSNNPHQPASGKDTSELLKKGEDGATPMAMAAAKGNLQPQYDYIRELPAIKRMKEIAKGA